MHYNYYVSVENAVGWLAKLRYFAIKLIRILIDELQRTDRNVHHHQQQQQHNYHCLRNCTGEEMTEIIVQNVEGEFYSDE